MNNKFMKVYYYKSFDGIDRYEKVIETDDIKIYSVPVTELRNLGGSE